jgi:uncharacterized membrane protein
MLLTCSYLGKLFFPAREPADLQFPTTLHMYPILLHLQLTLSLLDFVCSVEYYLTSLHLVSGAVIPSYIMACLAAATTESQYSKALK